jgi:hypothetical protein
MSTPKSAFIDNFRDFLRRVDNGHRLICTGLIELREHMMAGAAAGRLAPITKGRKLLGIAGRSDLLRAILKIKHQGLAD